MSTLADIQIDVGDLSALIDQTDDVLTGMDYGTGAGRNHELDRVASLTRIARDMAARIEAQVQAMQKKAELS